MGQHPDPEQDTESREPQQEISYLLLVPLEVGDEDKAVRGVWVLKNNPVGFCLLVENVVHPLVAEGERVHIQSPPFGEAPQAGLGKLSGPSRKDSPGAQGIHTQAACPTADTLSPAIPRPLRCRGRWLFRLLLVRSVRTLCCGHTGLVLIHPPLPTEPGESVSTGPSHITEDHSK